MPKTELIYYTGMESDDPYYAARLLAFTKNTRLNMTPDGFEKFASMPEEEIDQELDYMSKTIKTALEFADVMFLIRDVSRATAQQITRTRTAVFQMQSQRVSSMADATWDSIGSEQDEAMKAAIASYQSLLDGGASLEDARDVLPIGLHCNLVAKYTLRAAIDLIRARESPRVQGPYREVAQQMKSEILRVWPWAAVFFEDPNDKAFGMLLEVVEELKDAGAVYKGPAGKIAKAIDLIKGK